MKIKGELGIQWKGEGIRMNENERKKELEWMRMKELMN